MAKMKKMIKSPMSKRKHEGETISINFYNYVQAVIAGCLFIVLKILLFSMSFSHDPVIRMFHCLFIVLKISLFSMSSSHDPVIRMFHCLFISIIRVFLVILKCFLICVFLLFLGNTSFNQLKTFGVSLDELVRRNSESNGIPYVLKRITDYIVCYGKLVLLSQKIQSIKKKLYL